MFLSAQKGSPSSLIPSLLWVRLHSTQPIAGRSLSSLHLTLPIDEARRTLFSFPTFRPALLPLRHLTLKVWEYNITNLDRIIKGGGGGEKKHFAEVRRMLKAQDYLA